MHNATIEAAQGVVRRFESGNAVYTGQAQALIAAGVIEQHQIPGEPGNGRAIVTFNADGTRALPGCNRGKGQQPGKKRIVSCMRGGQPMLEVWLTLSPERVESIERATRCWPFPIVGRTFTGAPAQEARA